jgi:hypothetical protein
MGEMCDVSVPRNIPGIYACGKLSANNGSHRILNRRTSLLQAPRCQRRLDQCLRSPIERPKLMYTLVCNNKHMALARRPFPKAFFVVFTASCQVPCLDSASCLLETTAREQHCTSRSSLASLIIGRCILRLTPDSLSEIMRCDNLKRASSLWVQLPRGKSECTPTVLKSATQLILRYLPIPYCRTTVPHPSHGQSHSQSSSPVHLLGASKMGQPNANAFDRL